MSTRTSNERPRLAYTRPGPTVRGVTRLSLPTLYGAVYMPGPTQQYGGILPYPRGTVLRIDIGDARGCTDEVAALIVGALLDCAEIEVIGTDPDGVAQTCTEFDRAITRAIVRRSAAC
ncbi:hypothetical protein [Streptomyces sp. NPDC002889]|uniref:hypothetical protein n=1 Tax=Streptomyces sp. NPDC002889 TaxID=3364669 RepID=UPI00369F2123